MDKKHTNKTTHQGGIFQYCINQSIVAQWQNLYNSLWSLSKLDCIILDLSLPNLQKNNPKIPATTNTIT
jgi:hypothetical protein